MSFKEQAEQLVRERLPELKELSFGCRFLDEKDKIEYTVVERNDIFDKYGSGKNEVWSVPNFNKGYQADWRFDNHGCRLKIIGHPILLNHWLRVLPPMIVEYHKFGNDCEIVINDNEKLIFNLTTGQPNSEEDYRKIVELIK